jgi:hypothetical protein
MESWQFVVPAPDNRTECNVNTMVNYTGGVGQLARNIQAWSHRKGKRVPKHTNVLITGSSFMRQVYEALACRYNHLIVRGLVQLNSNLSTRNFGVFAPLPSARSGLSCRGYNSSQYFSAEVGAPHVLHESCQDSLSMVEYAGGLRVFYMFRQYLYDASLGKLFTALGLSPTDVDVVVTNYESKFNVAVMERVNPKVAVLHFEQVLPFFYKTQEKYCGWSDTVVNPGVGADHPDTHPCMPGIPDDEVDVLLLALAHGIKVIDTGMPAPCARCAEYGYNSSSALQNNVPNIAGKIGLISTTQTLAEG